MNAVTKAVLSSRASTAVLFLVLILVVNTTMSPLFLAPRNLSNVATAAIEIGLMALPATLLIVSGEIDLSIASTMAVSAAVLGLTVQAGAPWPVALLAALLTGLIAGLINGLLVTQLGLSSIIVTIGTLALFRGIAEVLLGDQTILGMPAEITGWNLHYLGGSLATWPHLFLVLAAVVFAIVLNRTRWGRSIKLIGSAPDVARYSGIAVARTKILLFALSGLVSAVAAVFLVSRLQAVRNDVGLGLELVAITVVLIGGTDLRGGRGTVWGTLLALVVVGSVRSGLRLANVPDQVGLSIVGILLIIAILVARWRDRFESRLARLHMSKIAVPPDAERVTVPNS